MDLSRLKKLVKSSFSIPVLGYGVQMLVGFVRLPMIMEAARYDLHLRKQLLALEQDLGALRARVNELDAALAGASREMRQLNHLRREYGELERKLGELFEEARRGLPTPAPEERAVRLAEEGDRLLDAFYASLEDEFRGTREEIKERLKVYLLYLQELDLNPGDCPMLDLGCGRGEWLELAREQGYQARGVDANRVMLSLCRERGLDVVEGDALEYLKGCRAESIGVLTGFHLIEHLPFRTMTTLFAEALRVLKPGGMAIFETPDPRNVLVGSCNFYIDPTHRNPVHPVTAAYLADTMGFVRNKIVALHPRPGVLEAEEMEIVKHFNEHFYGPQDYAVICYKS